MCFTYFTRQNFLPNICRFAPSLVKGELCEIVEEKNKDHLRVLALHVIAYRPVTLNQDIVTRTSGLSTLNSGWGGRGSNREGIHAWFATKSMRYLKKNIYIKYELYLGYLTTQWSILPTNPSKSDLICKNAAQRNVVQSVSKQWVHLWFLGHHLFFFIHQTYSFFKMSEWCMMAPIILPPPNSYIKMV